MLLSGGLVSFGPLWLSAILKQQGHECEISAIDVKEAGKICDSFRPDVIAYTCYTDNFVPMLELNRSLKKRYKFFSAFGGPHPTFSPEIIEEESIDGICLWEGFEAFPDLISRLEKGEDITTAENWHIRAEGRVHRNPRRPLLNDLDKLPFLDRSLLDKYKAYRATKSASVMSSIGCPFKCSYCFNHQLHKITNPGEPLIRRRSVDNVIEEVKVIQKNYPWIEYIIFRDDVFTSDKEWNEEFAEKFPKEIGLPFLCQSRPEYLKPYTVELLKKAGVFFIGIGLESTDGFLRKKILKRNVEIGVIHDAVSNVQNRNINYTIFNLMGLPHETFEIAYRNWEFNRQFRPSFAESSLMVPYPKTDIYNYSIKNGFLDPNKKYPHDIHDRIILDLKDKGKIENFSLLFGLVVEYPFLMPLVKVLIRLPMRPVYFIIRKLWKGYCYRNRAYPYKISIKECLKVLYDEMFVSTV